MTFDGGMDTDELLEKLDEQHQKYSGLAADEALSSQVDFDQFIEFVGSVENVDVGPGGVHVTFKEPVPSTFVDDLEDGYNYNIAVSRGPLEVGSAFSRCGMPDDSLLTLQQVSIVVWAIATGEIYKHKDT